MSRRAFTLLETVLAASLAGVVVLGCLGSFFAMERSDRALSARFAEANDLARIQRTMQRAFTSLQLSERSINEEEELEGEEGQGGQNGNQDQGGQGGQDGRGGDQGGLDAGGDGDGEDEAAADGSDEEVAAEPAVLPRIVLEPDTDPTLASMISRAKHSSGGGGMSSAVPQRLELVLSSVPIRPPSVQSSAWAAALVGVEDIAAEALEPTEEGEVAEAEEYDGLRGAFVLRPDDPNSREARSRAARSDDRIGWTLWWQPLDDRSEPARVASGLAACHFQMFRERQMVDQLVGASADDLPTYIQLEVETLSGLYANYLFEVVWTVDVFGEEEQSSTTNENGADGDQNGRGGQGGPNGGPNGGPGRRGGPDRATDRPGRPKPQTPQGLQPGQRVDARPRDGGRPVPPPGGGGR